MKEDMEVDALIVVDRHNAHPKIFVWIGDKERGRDLGDADMDILARRLAAPQRRIDPKSVSSTSMRGPASKTISAWT
jgi:hypothetical protein